MAVDFGSNVTQMPEVRSAVTPQQGVVEQSTLLTGLSSLFDQAGEALKANRASKNQKTIADFTRAQLSIADALDQGRISSSAHARTIIRKNLMDAIASNPTLSEDLVKAQASIMGLDGAAKIASEGSQMEQDTIRARSALIDAGQLAPDASDDEYRLARSNFEVAASAAQQHEERMRTLNLEKTTLEVGSARYRQIEEQEARAGGDLIRSTANVEYKNLDSRFAAIFNDPSLSEADKAVAAQQMYDQWNLELANRLGPKALEQNSFVLEQFNQLKANWDRRMTGEINDEELARSNERVLAQAEALATANPTIAKLAVGTKLFGADGMLGVMGQSAGVRDAFLDFVAGTNTENRRGPSNPFVKDTTDRAGLKAALGAITSAVNSPDPEQAEAGRVALERTLSSVEDYEAMLRKDPTAGTELVAWMASASFLEVAQQHPDLVYDSPVLKDIIERNYHDQVWSAAQNDFLQSEISVTFPADGGGPLRGTPMETVSASTPGLVSIRSTGGGVEFVANDPNNTEARAKASDLNRNSAPILNNAIKSSAHLEGRTDYRAVADTFLETFMGGELVPGRDAEISLQDFQARSAPLSNLANSEKLVNLMDAREGGGDYDTLFGFAQRGGGRYDGVKVSEMSIGEALEFSNPRGEYGNWVRRRLAESGQPARIATPMGRYQIVGSTLRSTALKMGLSMDTPFDRNTQDAMFAYLASEALQGKSSIQSKRAALRGVWEGFKHVSNAELDAAIEEFENYGN